MKKYELIQKRRVRKNKKSFWLSTYRQAHSNDILVAWSGRFDEETALFQRPLDTRDEFINQAENVFCRAY